MKELRKFAKQKKELNRFTFYTAGNKLPALIICKKNERLYLSFARIGKTTTCFIICEDTITLKEKRDIILFLLQN